MKDFSNENNSDAYPSLLTNSSISNSDNQHQQSGHQTVIIKNLEQSLKHNETSELFPNYYEWSLCDIHNAHNDLFNQISSRKLQSLDNSTNFQLEPLSYFNCKKLGRFSLIYDRLIHGGYLYSQQHFGTSQMNRPHPMRNSIPCEETFRWMPARSSSMIGRRAHLPLDLFETTSIKINKKFN